MCSLCRAGDEISEAEEVAVDKNQAALSSPACVPLEDILMDNTELVSHPMLEPDFVARNCREVPWIQSGEEFERLYAENQASEQELVESDPSYTPVDWSYPPDFKRMTSDPTYWGLGPGARVFCLTAMIL